MKTFSHRRPIRNTAGEIIEQRSAPAVRLTRGGLGYHHGLDKNKQLVVSLKDGDLIEMRPIRTQRTKTISAFDLYDYLIRLEMNAAERIKKEAKREARDIRLAQQRQERAEKRLFKKSKNEEKQEP